MILPKYIDNAILMKHHWAAGKRNYHFPLTKLALTFQELQLFNMKSQ